MEKEFDYNLPLTKIAKFPVENRDDSKLLHYNRKKIIHTNFKQLPNILPKNAMLVFNNTKVIRARLNFYKKTGARIEVFCLEPHNPSNIESSFLQTENVEWICMIGNVKKWKDDEISTNIIINNIKTTIYATIVHRLDENFVIKFSWNNRFVTFAEILEFAGAIPIPPYLEREAVESDNERYQTVYSKHKGSVAAPTAGLHFTENTLKKLSEKGLKSVEITLHVGAGTFKPIKSSSISEHIMHSEQFYVSYDTLSKIVEHKGPIIAVGTTSVRTLESLYWAGIKLKSGNNFHKIEQWDGFKYESELNFKEVFSYLIQYLKENNLTTLHAETSIMIIPKYKPKVIDGLITNFHQPRSTLLLLIAALVGNDWKKIYNYAIDNNFRFLSYGDSSFLEL